MSRRPTARAGWCRKAWGDAMTEPQWLWRLSTRHGSTGVLGDVGIHILDFASYGAADDIVSLKADLVTFPKVEGDRVGDYVLDANDSVAMTARLRSGALATIVATRFATGHANDLTLSLHGTKGALKVETDGQDSRLLGLPRQGYRQEPLEEGRNAAGEAQRKAFCRCADVGRQRRSVLPPRRRHPETDRRGVRKRRVGPQGDGRLTQPTDRRRGQFAGHCAPPDVA